MMAFLAALWNVLLVWDSSTILNLTFHLERCTSLQNEAHIKQSVLLALNLCGWQIKSIVCSVQQIGAAHLLTMIRSKEKIIIIPGICLANIVLLVRSSRP